jgi:hypothetical protein
MATASHRYYSTTKWIVKYLGSMSLWIVNDSHLMEKWIDFMNIKFHMNENIEWHCMQLELNWIELN